MSLITLSRSTSLDIRLGEATTTSRCGRRAGPCTLRFIRPGKPIENAYVESFNGKLRDECLNEHWLVGLVDAKAAIEQWRIDYNIVRPHSSVIWWPHLSGGL